MDSLKTDSHPQLIANKAIKMFAVFTKELIKSRDQPQPITFLHVSH